MQSLVTSIWVWEVSGMAENKSINVRTDISTAMGGGATNFGGFGFSKV
jgi:hypothetical protein